jgi:TolB-like protein/Tfp pilus assembly protein PilF
MDAGKFFAELKRRNVYRAAVAYGVVAWFLTQLTPQVFPFFAIPNAAIRLAVVALALGFPIAMLLAWIYELTPEGIVRADEIRPEQARSIQRSAGRLLDFIIIGVLLLAIALLLYERAQSQPSTGESITEKSIAVLPFENLSRDPDNAFFADGIQDDVLTSLGKISELKVISRTSVMQYRGANVLRNLREIARALGVENVLQGTVRRLGNPVLVNVQLIDARKDRQIWAERYDRTLADALTLQGAVATEIASALRATLSSEEKARLEIKPTLNAEAYVLYLKARELEGRVSSTAEDFIAAEQLYGKAIALDPGFALAHARASITNTGLYLQSNEQARKAKARAEAEEAVRLSPTLAEAHLALGLLLYYVEKDYEAALKAFATAKKTSPNNAEIVRFSGGIFRRQGRWRDALTYFQRAQDLDPRYPHDEVAVTYVALRDWSAAASAYRRLLQVAPEGEVLNAYCQISLANIEFAHTGSLAGAQEVIRKIPAAAQSEERIVVAIWEFSMLERHFAAAEKLLADVPSETAWASTDYPKSYYQACTALLRGDQELARKLFEQARTFLETEVRAHPEEPRRHASLGLIKAYIGDKEGSLREARRAVDVAPESKDVLHGALMASNLAVVYARTGEADQAIMLIERLLSTPGAGLSITLADLRFCWCWDPLRNDPRFQNLLHAPEPKTIY